MYKIYSQSNNPNVPEYSMEKYYIMKCYELRAFELKSSK